MPNTRSEPTRRGALEPCGRRAAQATARTKAHWPRSPGFSERLRAATIQLSSKRPRKRCPRLLSAIRTFSEGQPQRLLEVLNERGAVSSAPPPRAAKLQSCLRRGWLLVRIEAGASFQHAQHDLKPPNIIACYSLDGADSGTCVSVNKTTAVCVHRQGLLRQRSPWVSSDVVVFLRVLARTGKADCRCS
jgi:hypothetical protein